MKRRAPVSGSGTQRHIYVIKGNPKIPGQTFYIEDFWRITDMNWKKGSELVPAVWYGGHPYRRYSEKDLMQKLLELRPLQYDGDYPAYKNRTFNPKKDGLRPFILEWEGPIQ